MASIVKSLRAISDPTRLRLLLLLLEEELTVAELQEILGMSQSRISASLALLKREAIAGNRRVGKNIVYSVRPETVFALRSILDEARRELPDASHDGAALDLALRKRKDKAAEYFNKLAGKFGRTYIPGRSWQALAHALLRRSSVTSPSTQTSGRRPSQWAIPLLNAPTEKTFRSPTIVASTFMRLSCRESSLRTSLDLAPVGGVHGTRWFPASGNFVRAKDSRERIRGSAKRIRRLQS